MTMDQAGNPLSESLEDYLETIFRLVSKHKFARVRDIAEARNVRAASVSSALKRLADMNLVNYIQREYVTLTKEGEKEARRVYARHRLLTKFFHEILKMPMDAAERDACAMEHNLSKEAMDRLARFFEFLTAYPQGPQDFIHFFHKYLFAHEHEGNKSDSPGPGKIKSLEIRDDTKTVYDLQPGVSARVARVTASGPIRQRLLDMGIIPGTRVKMERVAPAGEPVWIVVDGIHLSLRKQEAESVLIDSEKPAENTTN